MPHSRYLPERMGSATISPQGTFEAGSFQTFTLTYTAGYFGIDDTGSIKIVHRFASDMGKPQFTDPGAWNYTTVSASNGAVLHVEYDGKRNIRPWDKTLFIRVVKGFLREGDRITVVFGDTTRGSPGMRIQTFVEPTFEFRVLVDAFATYDYVELPEQPFVGIHAGPPVRYKLILPSQVTPGETFAAGFKGEDPWGNPSDQVQGRLALTAPAAVAGLPSALDIAPGSRALRIDGLRCDTPGPLRLTALLDGSPVALSNPCLVVEGRAYRQVWADLHGQSEETIGTNSAEELIIFARDVAFLDAMSHQGNDFQITTPFWNKLNALTARYNDDGRFVIFPGYEWSGNTGLGGDRNVMFRHEGREIHRSSHALVDDLADAASDALEAADLFRKLDGEDVVVFAHIGGRYADIRLSHDPQIERSVEVHSDWGTFEWLLHDAFEMGYRVGILANSDGHKGRHGASHPGASLFGAYGGLSCLLLEDFDRDGLFEALRARRHFATTGCRAWVDVRLGFEEPATLYSDDPNLTPQWTETRASEVGMGSIVSTTAAHAVLSLEVHTESPIERIDVYRGVHLVRTLRPYSADELGRRIRMVFEGSEYRGRGRQSVWDGAAAFSGNRAVDCTAVNFWNLDKRLELQGNGDLRWQCLTTGGFCAADFRLEDPFAGTVHVHTPSVDFVQPIAEIGMDDIAFEAGGIGKRVRLFRLPDELVTRDYDASVSVALEAHADNPVYIRVTTEDGHLIWTSPIYVVPQPDV